MRHGCCILLLLSAVAGEQARAVEQGLILDPDATNHPGKESFDGELARFLIYERPLTNG